jgi:hypothetical protein
MIAFETYRRTWSEEGDIVNELKKNEPEQQKRMYSKRIKFPSIEWRKS